MRKVLFILSELADSDVDWLIENGSKESHRPGTVLIEEGKRTDMLYIVLSGQLSVAVSSVGKESIALLRSGEVIGELSFLDSSPPTATVTTDNDVTVLAVPRASLSEELERDAPFAARFYKALGVFLASRLRRSLRRLGYDNKKILDEDVLHEDELDAALLENLSLAGARFEWMLKRLQEARPAAPGT